MLKWYSKAKIMINFVVTACLVNASLRETENCMWVLIICVSKMYFFGMIIIKN